MKASSVAYDLIKEFESFEANAYPDPATGGEPWTIGYGTTVYPDGRKVRPGDTCTGEQAQDWLEVHVEEKCEDPINDALKVPVSQQMFDALVSWTYNVGEGAMRGSTLLRLLNSGQYMEAANEFDRWNKANGKVMNGLVRRRDSEEALYRQGTDQLIAFAKANGWLPDDWGTA